MRRLPGTGGVGESDENPKIPPKMRHRRGELIEVCEIAFGAESSTVGCQSKLFYQFLGHIGPDFS